MHAAIGARLPVVAVEIRKRISGEREVVAVEPQLGREGRGLVDAADAAGTRVIFGFWNQRIPGGGQVREMALPQSGSAKIQARVVGKSVGVAGFSRTLAIDGIDIVAIAGEEQNRRPVGIAEGCLIAAQESSRHLKRTRFHVRGALREVRASDKAPGQILRWHRAVGEQPTVRGEGELA